MNIPVHILATLERFVGELVLGLKDANFIENQKRIPCSDCCKPTYSACGRCPLHIRGYYVIQYYDRLGSKKGKETYEQIMDTHRDTLANLNITLCRECFHPIKLEEIEYCDSCQPE